jgi:Tfp pilus assembly protein PilF
MNKHALAVIALLMSASYGLADEGNGPVITQTLPPSGYQARYTYSYGYRPWVYPAPYYYPYPYFYPYSIAVPGQVLGPYVLPPVVIPAETMYGPQPLARFLGAQDQPGVGVVANPPQVNARPIRRTDPVDPPQRQRKPRTTNAAAKVRAGKFMQFGDAQFAKQKFHTALERYREATLAAPDLAETYFRQGFASFATGQYKSAAKAFERGLEIQPNWSSADLDLAKIYGDANQLALTSHREALAQAIEANSQDGDQLMVMGIVLFFDGEAERSLPFFQKAAQLGANEERLLDGFLTPRPEANEPGPAKR